METLTLEHIQIGELADELKRRKVDPATVVDVQITPIELDQARPVADWRQALKEVEGIWVDYPEVEDIIAENRQDFDERIRG